MGGSLHTCYVVSLDQIRMRVTFPDTISYSGESRELEAKAKTGLLPKVYLTERFTFEITDLKSFVRC